MINGLFFLAGISVGQYFQSPKKWQKPPLHIIEDLYLKIMTNAFQMQPTTSNIVHYTYSFDSVDLEVVPDLVNHFLNDTSATIQKANDALGLCGYTVSHKCNVDHATYFDDGAVNVTIDISNKH